MVGWGDKMGKRKLVWLIPIVVIAGIIAYVYPIGVTEFRDQPVQTEQLFGQQWILQSLMIDGQEVTLSANTRITIQFDEDGMVEGSGGCNTFSGDEYQVSGEYQIVVKSVQGEEQNGVGGSMSLGPIARTEMACLEPGLMEQENQFFTVLNQVTSFQVMPKSLKLTTQDEQTFLNFTTE